MALSYKVNKAKEWVRSVIQEEEGDKRDYRMTWTDLSSNSVSNSTGSALALTNASPIIYNLTYGMTRATGIIRTFTGDHVNPVSLKIRGTAVNGTANTDCLFRVLVVQDRTGADSLVASWSTFLDNSVATDWTLAPKNWYNRKNYKILRDFTLDLTGRGGSGGQGSFAQAFETYIPGVATERIDFGSTTTDSGASVVTLKNNLYLIFATNSASVNYSWSSELVYTC